MILTIQHPNQQSTNSNNPQLINFINQLQSLPNIQTIYINSSNYLQNTYNNSTNPKQTYLKTPNSHYINISIQFKNSYQILDYNIPISQIQTNSLQILNHFKNK